MFPVGDQNDHAGIAYVSILLVAGNVLAFFFQINRPEAAIQAFIDTWGVVPRDFTQAPDIPPAPVSATLLTSMFLHAGWGHLGGNMLFLWIFGDNLEHRLGHLRFLLFYLLCGLTASAAHILFNPASTIPAVGASGAISGVLGGYLLMFPRNRVYVLTWGGIFAVPAVFMLGLWILMQIVSGIGTLAVAEDVGGVAYMAHIGGFAAGLVCAPLFAVGRETAITSRRGRRRI